MTARESGMSKLIKTVEALKEKISNLKILYEVVGELEVDIYEPTEEGLDVVEVERHLPTLKAYIRKTANEEYKGKPGYREMQDKIDP